MTTLTPPCMHCGKSASDGTGCLPGRAFHMYQPMTVATPRAPVISAADGAALLARLTQPSVLKAHLVINHADGRNETVLLGPWQFAELLWLAFTVEEGVRRELAAQYALHTEVKP